jgi:hypothetical protein
VSADGLRYYNDAEFMCKQPLDLTLPNSKNHTLTILLVVSSRCLDWQLAQCCCSATDS